MRCAISTICPTLPAFVYQLSKRSLDVRARLSGEASVPDDFQRRRSHPPASRPGESGIFVPYCRWGPNVVNLAQEKKPQETWAVRGIAAEPEARGSEHVHQIHYLHARHTGRLRIDAGKFPAQIKLGARAVGRLQSEIQAWLAERLGGSRGGASV